MAGAAAEAVVVVEGAVAEGAVAEGAVAEGAVRQRRLAARYRLRTWGTSKRSESCWTRPV